MYALQEILELAANGKQKGKQTTLEIALNDFNYTIDQLLDGLLRPTKHFSQSKASSRMMY